MDKEKESDLCVCGHTRNYHHTGFFGGYAGCEQQVQHIVGNRVYLETCACQRFGLMLGLKEEKA